MKQLKIDHFLTGEGHELLWQRSRPRTLRSVIRAYTEYEDVSQNTYVCRSRKVPSEISYCHCAARADWRETCGPGCENRAAKFECVAGHCFSTITCGNQRMQRGEHAAVGLQPIEGKGMSLIADVAIAKDDLVAQYVGEVLSREMYANRELAEAGRSRHTYGMVVTDKEVIDARYVGGMARFANHSCDPNCDVERWEVAGETCCGLFANRAIGRGEEITISYGSRFSADRHRIACLCGSANCKGYL